MKTKELRWGFMKVLMFLLSLIALGGIGGENASYGNTTESDYTTSFGSENAPCTIICYSSFTCTHCAQFYDTVFPILKEKYIDTGHVRYIMKDYPLDRVALMASQLARCQGKENYSTVADAFYQRQKEWLFSKDPEKALKRVAEACGIMKKDIQNTLNDKNEIRNILSQRLDAQKRFKIRYTPTFIINGKKIEGALSLEQLEEYLSQNQPFIASSADTIKKNKQ